MEEIKLDVQVRDHLGTRKVKKIRRENFVPGIVYGGEKKDSTPIQVDRRSYEKIMRIHHGQNVIFHLSVLKGDKKLHDYSAIVREEQHEPASYTLLHLDFQRISLTEEIEVKVRIEVEGEPIGVKKDGGSLDHALWELDVICLPTNIPEKLAVSVGHLVIGDAIYVRDILLPPGVKTKHDPEAIVVSVVPPMKEELTTAVEGAEPEVIGEKSAKAEGEEEKGDEKKEAKGEAKAEEKTEKKAEGGKEKKEG